ncbi:hypothetical protein [Actinocorallia lasiicapitis]
MKTELDALLAALYVHLDDLRGLEDASTTSSRSGPGIAGRLSCSSVLKGTGPRYGPTTK